MFGTIRHQKFRFHFAILGILAAAMLCLALSGCAGWDLRGEKFPDNGMSGTIKQARPPANKSEFWSFSNKARQIEEDFGSQ